MFKLRNDWVSRLVEWKPQGVETLDNENGKLSRSLLSREHGYNVDQLSSWFVDSKGFASCQLIASLSDSSHSSIASLYLNSFHRSTAIIPFTKQTLRAITRAPTRHWIFLSTNILTCNCPLNKNFAQMLTNPKWTKICRECWTFSLFVLSLERQNRLQLKLMWSHNND